MSKRTLSPLPQAIFSPGRLVAHRERQKKAWPVFAAFFLSLLFFTHIVKAADETVTHGWANVLPAVKLDEQGQPTGFSLELARHIAKLAGFNLSLRYFETVPKWIQGQAEGKAHMLVGAAALPDLQATNLFSEPVATTRVRLFVRVEEAGNVDVAVLSDQKIGTVPPVAGSQPSSLLSRNINVKLPSLGTALLRLLSGDVDGVLLPEEAMFSEAHAAGLDHRIAAVGPPVKEFNRVVAVHQSRIELLPRINSAIAELQASGKLAELRERWFLESPPEEQEFFTVGVSNFPPYQVVNEDGSFTGFAVELMKDLATRIDLSLRFVEISQEDFAAGPSGSRYDMLPQAGISQEREARFDFTLPIKTERVSIFVRGGEAGERRTLDDFEGQPIGVYASNLGRRIAETSRSVKSIVFDDLEELLRGLLEGQIEAVLITEETFMRLAKAEGVAGLVGVLPTPVREIERGIALRRGLGTVREQLNSAIPVYLTSDTYRTLQDSWFGSGRPWWGQHAAWLLGAAAALTLTVLLTCGYLLWRRRAENALAKQRLISDIFRDLPFAVTLNDPRGRIRFFNAAYQRMYPKSADLMVEGVDYAELILQGAIRGEYELEGAKPEEWARHFTTLHKDAKANYDVKLADGRIVEAHTFVVDRGNRLIVRRDVTKERRREEERLRAVLDTATSGIVGLDTERNIIFVNPVARLILGGNLSTLPCPWPSTITFLDHENLEPLEASMDPLDRALAGQMLKGEINLMSRPGGSDHHYVRISSARVAISDNPVAVVVVLDDVSEQERNRQQVERASRLDALGQLTGGIAHDFNNLLATIQYALDLSLKDNLSDDTRQFLDTAASSVKRGAKLTNRLLTFAKRQPGLAQSKNVDELLEEFRTLARPTIEEAIELVFPEPNPDLLVFCDAAQLENALLNLILNSRDAIIRTGKGNKIEVSVRRINELEPSLAAESESSSIYRSTGMQRDHAAEVARDDSLAQRYIEIAVTDNGPGMRDEVKRRALDPFFTTKATNSGTGLGLSMVYGFVQQSDGELRIYSEEGHGTSVCLRLPAGGAEGRREASVERASKAVGHGERILIVEDEDMLRAMIEEQVKALDYEALSVSSGDEALVLADDGVAFDLLLTDVVMPGNIGGFDLARAMRERMPELPIIYMSGYTGFSKKDMGDVSAPFLQKPCTPIELANTLRDALSAKSEVA